eukprot:7725472-Karenia_brevis.AAC.1
MNLDGERIMCRSFRALRGWRKATPVYQRLPIPWVVTAAIIGHCLHHQRLTEAVAIATGFICYLRPGELDGLTKMQVISPSPMAGIHYRQFGLLLHPTELHTPGKT